MMVIGLRGPFGTAHDHPDLREGMAVIHAQHQGLPLPCRQGPDRLPQAVLQLGPGDRKSTRLNSSHVKISYAGCCLKKKKDYEPCVARRKKRFSLREGQDVHWI